MYDYFKQVSRRRHQFGDPKAMSFVPLSPLDHERAASAETTDSEKENRAPRNHGHGHPSGEKGGKGRTKPPHQLPPLATSVTAGAVQGRDRSDLDSRASDRDRDAKDEAEMMLASEDKGDAQRQVWDACVHYHYH